MIKPAEDFKTFLTRMSEEFGALSSLLEAHGLDVASTQARARGNVCASEALSVEKVEGPVTISRSEELRREEIVGELNRLRKIEKAEAERGLKEWRKNSR